MPNTLVNGRIGISYNKLGASVGTDIDGSQKDEEGYGSTDYMAGSWDRAT